MLRAELEIQRSQKLSQTVPADRFPCKLDHKKPISSKNKEAQFLLSLPLPTPETLQKPI